MFRISVRVIKWIKCLALTEMNAGVSLGCRILHKSEKCHYGHDENLKNKDYLFISHVWLQRIIEHEFRPADQFAG
jgi:hypothetical protein